MQCQVQGQFFVYVIEVEQVFCWLCVGEFFFGCNGFGQQVIFGMGVQFVDDVFVEVIDVEYFFYWYVGDFFKSCEVFFYQYLGQFFVDIQFVDEVLQDIFGFGLLFGLDICFGYYIQGLVG